MNSQAGIGNMMQVQGIEQYIANNTTAFDIERMNKKIFVGNRVPGGLIINIARNSSLENIVGCIKEYNQARLSYSRAVDTSQSTEPAELVVSQFEEEILEAAQEIHEGFKKFGAIFGKAI